MNRVNQKSDYISPEVEFLLVRIEEGILAGSNPNAIRPDSASSGYDNSWDLGEI